MTHLAAIATGLPDFLAIMREGNPARRPATSHVIFGVSLLVVQVLNIAVRNAGDLPAGGSIAMPLIVNIIAVTLTSVQGWYGGELVYRHLIGYRGARVVRGRQAQRQTAPLSPSIHKFDDDPSTGSESSRWKSRDELIPSGR